MEQKRKEVSSFPNIVLPQQCRGASSSGKMTVVASIKVYEVSHNLLIRQ